MQTIRYIGSIIFGFFFVTSLNLIARFNGFKTLAVCNWIFVGPSNFLENVNEAVKFLKKEESGLLSDLRVKYTIIHSPTRFLFLPAWKYGGVSDEYLAWGRNGVLAAWVFIYYNYSASGGSRWLLSSTRMCQQVSNEAHIKTYEWLCARNFPNEICDAFKMRQP